MNDDLKKEVMLFFSNLFAICIFAFAIGWLVGEIGLMSAIALLLIIPLAYGGIQLLKNW